MKSMLMIAFHYPPVRGSSGLQRTLAFSRHLRDCGWQAMVLTANARAYPQSGDDQLDQVPADVPVTRAFALDAARHLAWRGAYLKATALPDRWISWWPAAVTAGLRLIRRHRPEVIWSTFPIATAHLIGLALHRLTGLPWIADFRDNMTADGYPADATRRRVLVRIEQLAVQHAARLVFASPGTARMYAKRFPEVPAGRWHVIANGYDEASFVRAQAVTAAAMPVRDSLRLVHSGLLNPRERDPSAFFAALATLRRSGTTPLTGLRVILRATGFDAHYRTLLQIHGLEDIVRLEQSLPYADALAEMLAADGLLLFQAPRGNHLIPAKTYEYLRAGRPILALTDPRGDTAQVLANAGVGTVLAPDSTEEIARGLPSFLAQLRAGTAMRPDQASIACHSRALRTQELARLAEAVAAEAAQRAAARAPG